MSNAVIFNIQNFSFQVRHLNNLLRFKNRKRNGYLITNYCDYVKEEVMLKKRLC